VRYGIGVHISMRAPSVCAEGHVAAGLQATIAEGEPAGAVPFLLLLLLVLLAGLVLELLLLLAGLVLKVLQPLALALLRDLNKVGVSLRALAQSHLAGTLLSFKAGQRVELAALLAKPGSVCVCVCLGGNKRCSRRSDGGEQRRCCWRHNDAS
jgi:hypothetical protein